MSLSSAIGFIGGGQMATAIYRGLVRKGIRKAADLYVYDVNASARQAASTLGINAPSSAAIVAESTRVILICVKPDAVPTVLRDLRPNIGSGHLLISVAAGVTTRALEAAAGSGLGVFPSGGAEAEPDFKHTVSHPGPPRIVRVMPNTPSLVGEGATGISAGTNATGEDVELTRELFSAVGQAHVVDEKMLDAVTGLAGSGPAYALLFIEALADGGVFAGLPRPAARALAAQTVLGTARMVLTADGGGCSACGGVPAPAGAAPVCSCPPPPHTAELRDRVSSPAGTTVAGLKVLEDRGVRGAVISAVAAATDRARELGEIAQRETSGSQ